MLSNLWRKTTNTTTMAAVAGNGTLALRIEVETFTTLHQIDRKRCLDQSNMLFFGDEPL